MIVPYIHKKRQLTIERLTDFQKQIEKTLPPISPWSGESIKKLFHFSQGGKMLRAVLVHIGYELFANKRGVDVTPVGVALELFHSGFLIHDDIMDKDEKRRGEKSMHVYYREQLEGKVHNPQKTGESVSVCMGDISFFLGYQLIASSHIPASHKECILSTISHELTNVAIAQMQDVYGGSTTEKRFSEQDILTLYRYKTGRYTCGLPLVLGAMLGNADEAAINHLWKIGETLGIIFQIQDDRLNILGDEDVTGKSVGSDIREGKQTLYTFWLRKYAKGDELKRISTIIGNKNCTHSDIAYIRSLIGQYTIDRTIDTTIGKLQIELDHMIAELDLSSTKVKLLKEFVDYVLKRVK